MLKYFILFLIFAFFSHNLTAQEIERRSQNVFFEIGGHGLIYSINYQRQIKGNWNGRGGIGFLRVIENETDKYLNFWSIPLDIRHEWKSKNERHGFELGVGVQLLIGSGNISSFRKRTDLFINPSLIASYRYYTKKNMFFSASFTPFYGTRSLTEESGYFELYDPMVINGTTIHLWMGLGIGYKF
ncbi:hypothetical protein Aoki45_23890 [Algoriphagus sp. oki45]|uniref:hypothetical protein n=1 Tax=Algoriphagus sp. oki45 TaxID=3067294 RepID=UPI0027F0805F|nr:hypothetical protein Aoki45_23890 [Algoriphagus sp. oki45]